MPLLGFRFSPTVNGLAEERRKGGGRIHRRVSLGDLLGFALSVVCANAFAERLLKLASGNKTERGGSKLEERPTDRMKREGGGRKKGEGGIY